MTGDSLTFAAALAVVAGCTATDHSGADPVRSSAAVPGATAATAASDDAQGQAAVGAAEVGEARSPAVLPGSVPRPALTATDGDGRAGSARLVVTAADMAPTIKLRTPVDGQLFALGETVPFEVEVSDPEDGAIDCSRVKVTYAVGHDNHAHAITSQRGCRGAITIPVDSGHATAANLHGVFDAEYTDSAGVTSHAVRRLQPKHRQAEHFNTSAGIRVALHLGAEGSRTVGYIDDGDWISFDPYALDNATRFRARVASAGAGGVLEVRSGSLTGRLLGSFTIPVTGSWDTYTDVSGPLQPGAGGSTALYLVFKRAAGARDLFDVDSFTFETVSRTEPDPVLAFTKTAGWRHDSIPAGIDALRAIGAAGGFSVDASESALAFTAANLARYKAVVFLSTTGDVLNAAQQAALQAYVDGGGGFVGIHAAADTEYDWPYYRQLVGAWFASHPHVQEATVHTEDFTHPATAHLGARWSHQDEWYNYRSNPRGAVRVLQRLDESSYDGGDMGDHPITWCHAQGAGRSFYTGLGHTKETYARPEFRALLLGAIRYATGAAPADCQPR